MQRKAQGLSGHAVHRCPLELNEAGPDGGVLSLRLWPAVLRVTGS